MLITKSLRTNHFWVIYGDFDCKNWNKASGRSIDLLIVSVLSLSQGIPSSISLEWSWLCRRKSETKAHGQTKKQSKESRGGGEESRGERIRRKGSGGDAKSDSTKHHAVKNGF